MGIVAVVCNVASKPQAQYAALIFIGVVALARHEMARGGVPRSLAASLGKAGPGEYTYDDGESGVQPMATQITVNYPAGPGPAGLGGLTVTASITDARATGLAAVAAAAHDTMQFPRTVPAVLAFDPNVHPLSGTPATRPSIGNFLTMQVLSYIPGGPIPKNVADMVYLPSATGSHWEPFQWFKGEDYARLWSLTAARVLRWSTRDANLVMNRTESPEVAALFEWVKGVTMVHFRCSDTPFVRKSGHLQHKGYWEFVAAQIVAQGGGKRVVFTLCTEWLAETGAGEQCPVWLRQSQRWLQQALPTGQGYSVDPTPRCWSVRTTWSLFREASMLVSGIESSFSFIPGMTKGKRYITPKMTSTNPEERAHYPEGIHNSVHWTMYSGDPIFHTEVDDYKTFSLLDADT